MGSQGERRREKVQRRKRRQTKGQNRRQANMPKPLIFSPLPSLPSLSSEDYAQWSTARADKVSSVRTELLDVLGHTSWPMVLASNFLYRSTAAVSPKQAVEFADVSVQPAIEYLQALALTLPRDRMTIRPIPGTVAERAFMLADQIVSSILLPMKDPQTEADPQRGLVLELLRGHAISVRGPGYPHQVDTLTKAVLSRTHSNEKVEPLFLLDLLTYLDQEIERRINEFVQILGPTSKIKTWEEATATLTRHLPQHVDIVDIVQSWRDIAEPRVAAHIILETLLMGALSFTEIQLKGHFGEPRGALASQTLHAWSMEPGDLASANLDHIPTDNPVWSRPVIALPDGVYFLPNPAALHSFRWELIERALSADSAQLESYRRARAKVLEDSTASEFERLFGKEAVHRACTWADPRDGRSYESDVLVVFDLWLIIVECKAHASRGAARRGAPEGAKKLGQGIFYGAGEQSARLKSLLETGAKVEIQSNQGFLSLQPDKYRRIERLTVTFDFIGSISARRHAQAALAQKGTLEAFAIAMPITDLQILVDALETPERALHYLHNRPALETRFYFAGDETDLLALYLRTRFSSGHLKQFSNSFISLALSRSFDSWYLPSPELAAGPSGRLRDVPLWKDLLDQVKKLRGEGWSCSAVILSGVPMELQVDAERAVGQLRRRVAEAGDFLRGSDVIVLQANWDESEVVALWVHPDSASREEVRRRNEAIAQNVIDGNATIQCVLVISLIQTPTPQFAYTMSRLAVRRGDTNSTGLPPDGMG